MEAKTRITFDYDDEKAKLVKKSALIEGDIEQNIQKIIDYFEDNGKNAIVIGGSLIATYLLVRLLTSSSDDKTVHTLPSSFVNTEGQQVVQVIKEEESPIVKQIKDSITLFLISIAKQKLQEFIENYGKEKTKSE